MLHISKRNKELKVLCTYTKQKLINDHKQHDFHTCKSIVGFVANEHVIFRHFHEYVPTCLKCDM